MTALTLRFQVFHTSHSRTLSIAETSIPSQRTGGLMLRNRVERWWASLGSQGRRRGVFGTWRATRSSSFRWFPFVSGQRIHFPF